MAIFTAKKVIDGANNSEVITSSPCIYHKCMRLTLLELFGEDVSTAHVPKSECFDVGTLESFGNSDLTCELSMLLKLSI